MNENPYVSADLSEIPSYLGGLALIVEELINGIQEGGTSEYLPYAGQIIGDNLRLIGEAIEQREAEYMRDKVSDEEITASQYLKLKDMLSASEIEEMLSELGKKDLSELTQRQAVIALYESENQ